ncbi:sodium:proton antiporter [Aliidiomarina sedimenti]|uniref:Sodium:proton antiporter n=1 Tax=Aliidiomarina sedimenti TaxID=1933879 RepID=A0ABY0BYU9_9GAMM|nr:Na+/H+ antiporter NhaC family protein [Aliidiomarina sedimenti]RUO29860.1 sodium:proton antiporter [Aliidiomarina sedimenti]
MDGSWYSLLPSLLAIVFAILTRRVILALLGGVLLANGLFYAPDLLSAFLGSVVSLSSALVDPGNMQIWAFTLIIGALFGVLEGGGTFRHFVAALERRRLGNSPRKARLFTWFLGVAVFIESNVSIMTSGTTSRPLYDRLGMSREKLAYLIDSTCAPICILIPLNAWGAFNLGLISAQDIANPLLTFAQSLLFNFYAILAIVLALWVAWSGWSIGPMRKADRRALTQAEQNADAATQSEPATADYNSAAARSVMLSLLSMIVLVPLMLLITGNGSIVQGAGTTSVLVAVSCALALAVFGARISLQTSWRKLGWHALQGARKILPLAIILWLAMVLGDMTRMLGTASFITSLIDDSFPVWVLLPTTFILAALTAFAIGSSWGTFAIMLPLAIPLALSLGLPPAPFIAAAISGGIFGDHASPISDTTILASLAAGTEHIDHVRTQLPYALLAAFGTILLYLTYGLWVM